MFDVATSQLTTIRWELDQELAHYTEHGFSTVSLWRPKVSDTGIDATVAALARSGMRVSSLQWAGGFTGSDGRSFRESVADAAEAITTAAALAAAAPADESGAVVPPAVVVHSGCRGGHTRSHASRLLAEALSATAPLAERAGVRLAVKPVHPRAACGCSFLTDLAGTLDLVESFASPHVRLALDLWQFADFAGFDGLLPRLAQVAAVVQVADRCGPPSPEADRLPAGSGCLPLERIISELWAAGYRGCFEFDPVGESVEMLGYAGTLHDTRRVADAWALHLAADVSPTSMVLNDTATPGAVIPGSALPGAVPTDATATDLRRTEAGRIAGYRAPATAGSRRSQASSHTVSRG
jgi:sugar phosphate isomerase/epimerase